MEVTNLDSAFALALCGKSTVVQDGSRKLFTGKRLSSENMGIEKIGRFISNLANLVGMNHWRS
jgi:hypothetical protein